MQAKSDIVVIGGGIIGICSAWNLQKKGYSVSLIERDKNFNGASSGNCGLLAVSEIVPISRPGVLSNVFRWVIDPESPLIIRPGYLLKMMPWLYKFLNAGKSKRVSEIVEGLSQLTKGAFGSYEKLLAECDIQDVLHNVETICLFHDLDDARLDDISWELRESAGFKCGLIDNEALHILEPEIDPMFTVGMNMKGWHYFSDPQRLIKLLVNDFKRHGGKIHYKNIIGFETNKDRVTNARFANETPIYADKFVISAGAWSHQLAKQLGDVVPLEAMAGYNATIRSPGVNIKRPLVYQKGGFTITPMEMGLRIGGTLELGGLKSKANYERARQIVSKTKKVLPNLEVNGISLWCGYRPMLPDTLPVLDTATYFHNVIYAFGHGQLGLTLGAVSGEIVTELTEYGMSKNYDTKPYNVKRFG